MAAAVAEGWATVVTAAAGAGVIPCTGVRGPGELMTGVAVPLLLALLQLDDDELEVDMFEHEPIEQHEAEEEEEEEEELELPEFDEVGLRRLRSLLGLTTPLLS